MKVKYEAKRIIRYKRVLKVRPSNYTLSYTFLSTLNLIYYYFFPKIDSLETNSYWLRSYITIISSLLVP